MKHMSCEEVRERMSYYLDETLPQEELEAFKAHLSGCAGCREELEQLKEIICLLSEIPESPVPDRFDLEFRRALKNEINGQSEANDSNKKKRPAWKSMSAVAAVLVVGVLSFAMLNDGLSIGTKDLALQQNRDGGGLVEMNGAPKTSDAAIPSELSLAGGEGEQEQPCAYGANIESQDMQKRMIDGGQKKPSVQYYRSGGMTNSPDHASSAENQARAYDGSGAAADEAADTKEDAPLLTQPAAGGGSDSSAETGGITITDEAISRGAGSFSSAEEYNAACEDWIGQYTQAINTKDSALFADIVAKAGINGYTTNTADNVLALYSDYLGDGAVTSKLLRSNSTKMESSYVIEGSRHKLKIAMKTTSSGLEVKEVLLDHGPWLYTQLTGTDFSLDTYEVRGGGNEITFKILFQPNTAEMSDGADTEQLQTKEIVWKKTE